MHPRRIVAIYGKAGIGKSTVSSNISAALSQMGEQVMQVGCDPKRDSIATLCGELKPTFMEKMQEKRKVAEADIDEVIFTGFNGVYGIECGGPKPGRGCAGKGVNWALETLDKHNIFDKYGATVVIFDVLGDVVCGGFSQPIRSGYAKEMYIVVCGEVLTLFQANNILKAVVRLHETGVDVGVAGIINNMRGVEHEQEIVEAFGKLIGVPVIEHIPRSKVVQEAEFDGKTVIEAFPGSEQADVYRRLARKILENKDRYIPRIASLEDIERVIIQVTETELGDATTPHYR
ncbi:MAG: nitrogenase iron protein [Clostridia bacterium]|nr:MAG: nitrogenase iron protein [Clostridia bacterium]